MDHHPPRKILLLNMPFAALDVPSLALTQLKAVLKEAHGEQVQIEIVYLNYDFVSFLGGHDAYQFILGMDGLVSGLGDWFFRQAAFPELPDNSEDYFRRYHNGRDSESEGIRAIIREKRKGLVAFLEQLIDRYQLADADMVGFTSLFSQNVSSFAMARLLKARNPNLVTVMGGPNCEYPMGEAIAREVAAIDFVFAGPALENFPELVGHMLDNRAVACHEVDGVFSAKNADIHDGARAMRGRDRDLDRLIELDYDDFLAAFDRHYAGSGLKPTLLFQTSTGCSWGERCQCSFCGVNGASLHYRHMSPDMAARQFASLFRYADRCRRFDSVDNIVPHSYLQELFPRLETPPNTLVFYETKSDLKRQEMQQLSRGGAKFVQPGIEALSTPLLKLMRKGTSAFGNLNFLKNCLLTDVYPFWNLLVGLPGTEESVYLKYLEDIPALVHLPPPTGAYPIRFDRFSLYFDQAEDYRLDLHPYDFYALTYPFSAESLRQVAYFFADHNGEAEYALLLSRRLPELREKVTAWLNAWYAPGVRQPPRLYFSDNCRIYDSRDGEARTIELPPTAIEVLRRLEKRTRLVDLEKEFGTGAGEILKTLQEYRLLFQEGETFLSLVLEREPARMSYDLTAALKLAEPAPQPADEMTSPAAPLPQKEGIKRQPRQGRRIRRAG